MLVGNVKEDSILNKVKYWSGQSNLLPHTSTGGMEMIAMIEDKKRSFHRT